MRIFASFFTKYNRVFLVVIGFASSITQAGQSMSNAFVDAQTLGNERIASIDQATKGVNSTVIPGYAGKDVAQSHYGEADLASISAASPEVQDSEAGKLVVDSVEEGNKYRFDPQTDPLFVEAGDIVNNPEKQLGTKFVEQGAVDQQVDNFITCEEGGEETLEEAEEKRFITVPQLVKQIPCHVYSHGWGQGLSRNVVTGAKYDGTTSNTTHYAAGITLYSNFPAELKDRVYKVAFADGYQPSGGLSLSANGTLSVPTAGGNRSREHGYWRQVGPYTFKIDIFYHPDDSQINERVESNCQYLEDKVEQGLCTYEDIINLEGPETRDINGYIAKRDWWRRKKIYRCRYPSLNNCEALRAKGCYQTASTCKQKVGKVCVIWQQTYNCPKGKKTGKSWGMTGKDNPFCLSGNCVDQSYNPNTDFMDTMSKLAMLKEAGNDLRKVGAIFKGQGWGCTIDCIGFRDCCKSCKGWGVSIGFAGCTAAEKELTKLREQKRCIRVGTYCAAREPVTKICLRKKTNFCCYDSKLARIVQEQGKSQLGLNFGDPEHPQCQGLTITQLSQVDFGKIDFSDLFADIMAGVKLPDAQGMTQSIQKSMADRGNLMQSPKTSQAKDKEPLVQGRGQGEF